MTQTPRRVLWLINHSTLRKFEVPLLESLGYEIYLPKLFPYDEGNLSASIDTSRDASLTIPRDALETLNAHNFYLGMTPEVAGICNRYFDVAFFGFFPDQLAGLVRSFRGAKVMRPFGLGNDLTYTGVTVDTLGYYFLTEIERNRETFWFGQAYPNLAEIEHATYKSKAITLPLGLDDARVTNEWTGIDKKVLFVCPRINSSSYYKNVHEQFVSTFGDLPHVIGGAQPVPVDDPTVLGHLSRAEYDRMMRETAVMFYHSQERRHLHYHPLEGVRLGMPLIFMANGMLDDLGGAQLPGRAKTQREAKAKVRKILSGDQKFIDEVRSSQGVLLDTMTREYCEPRWKDAFSKIEASYPSNSDACEKLKIAVFLPLAFKGGTLNMVKLLAKMIKRGANERGDEIEVVFAHIDDPSYSSSDFADLAEYGITTRKFKWRPVSDVHLAEIQALSGYASHPTQPTYWLPNDAGYDFLDCDFWFLGANRFEYPVAPLRPYCVFTHDYLQRYFPSVFPDYFENGFFQTSRNAMAVLANTPHTIEDVVQYVGVPRRKTLLVPHVAELDPFRERRSPQEASEPYFIWTTNVTPHKNHIAALEALELYWTKQGGTLNCHVTGLDTDKFDPTRSLKQGDGSDHIFAVREYLRKSDILRSRIKFKGNVSSDEYVSEVSGARFLFHSVVMDNGTLCAVEAAYAGVPTLSSDYPPMRYISERYGLNCQFFEASDPIGAAASLHRMEREASGLAKQLPTADRLEAFSWQATSTEFYSTIRPLLGLK